jgi:hypothetical protein
MAREHLSSRRPEDQPGGHQEYRESEDRFGAWLVQAVDPKRFRVVDKPRDLAGMFGDPTKPQQRALGVVPEASLTYRSNGRGLYFEVKKQGPRGNAEERACKHHTVEFQKRLKAFLKIDYHPFITIMCENLATDSRYTIKHPFFFEPDHFFCWCAYDSTSDLCAFLDRVAHKYLCPDDLSSIFLVPLEPVPPPG